MNYVFKPAPTVSIPLADKSAEFPVRRIYCVGRNYAAHVREMGFDPSREPPFFFCKPADAIVVSPAFAPREIAYPSGTKEFHFEMELVVAIGAKGRNVSVEDAPNYIWGYAAGLDMTRRDLQIEAREKGRPWELGKSFDESAPISLLHRAADVKSIESAALWLEVDGKKRQQSTIGNLIWNVPEIIANLSTYFELQPGDLIFTGTPDGVGSVVSGQVLHGGIDGLTDITIKIA